MVAVALVVTAIVLDGVLGDSLRDSAELDASRRAAVTAAQLTATVAPASRPTPTCRCGRRSRQTLRDGSRFRVYR